MQEFIDYEGRVIILSDESERHLAQEHIEVPRIGLAAVLRGTLADPDVVIASRRDSRGALYYRLRSEDPFAGKYVCVVVKYLENESYIWTAYVTSRIRDGRVIWTREQ